MQRSKKRWLSITLSALLTSVTAWISLKFLERPLIAQRKRVLALIGKA